MWCITLDSLTNIISGEKMYGHMYPKMMKKSFRAPLSQNIEYLGSSPTLGCFILTDFQKGPKFRKIFIFQVVTATETKYKNTELDGTT